MPHWLAFRKLSSYLVVVLRDRRSACPIAYALDLFGDRWTLLLLRDLIMLHKRHFREFLDSGEGIATNVLADRLARLEEAGMVTKERDPADRKRFVYRPTAKANDTLPIMLEMIAWSARYDSQTPVSAAFLRRIREHRPALLAEILAKGVR
jgi:DNA-binding HxlR family transcriptional regulator